LLVVNDNRLGGERLIRRSDRCQVQLDLGRASDAYDSAVTGLVAPARRGRLVSTSF